VRPWLEAQPAVRRRNMWFSRLTRTLDVIAWQDAQFPKRVEATQFPLLVSFSY
jgi:hypothetical protein